MTGFSDRRPHVAMTLMDVATSEEIPMLISWKIPCYPHVLGKFHRENTRWWTIKFGSTLRQTQASMISPYEKYPMKRYDSWYSWYSHSFTSCPLCQIPIRSPWHECFSHGTWRADATHCVRSRRAPHGRRQPGVDGVDVKLWWKLHSWGCIFKKTRQCLEKLRDVSTIIWLLLNVRVPTFTHIITYTSFWACGLWFTTILWFRTS